MYGKKRMVNKSTEKIRLLQSMKCQVTLMFLISAIKTILTLN